MAESRHIPPRRPSVLIVYGRIPLRPLATESWADSLSRALEAHGCRVARLTLPLPSTFAEDGDTLADHLAAFRLLDLRSCDGEPADLMIALDAVSCAPRHETKILWWPQGSGLSHVQEHDRLSSDLRRYAAECVSRFVAHDPGDDPLLAGLEVERLADPSSDLQTDGWTHLIDRLTATLDLGMETPCES